MPSAKIVSWSSAPPEKRLIIPYRPSFSTCAKQACTFETCTPGAGTWEPSLKMAMISRTNNNLRRRSGVRNALAKAPSTWSSFYTCGISLVAAGPRKPNRHLAAIGPPLHSAPV